MSEVGGVRGSQQFGLSLIILLRPSTHTTVIISARPFAQVTHKTDRQFTKPCFSHVVLSLSAHFLVLLFTHFTYFSCFCSSLRKQFMSILRVDFPQCVVLLFKFSSTFALHLSYTDVVVYRLGMVGDAPKPP